MSESVTYDPEDLIGTGEPARAPAERADPLSLEEHLSRGYAARFHLEGSNSEPVALVVARLRDSGLPRARLEAERAKLQAVEARCVVSRTGRELLDLVLAEMPA